MKKVPHENIIGKHGDSILTNKAVIQEKESFLGNRSYVEIPLTKIDSISRSHVFMKIFLVLALFLVLMGTYIYNDNQDFSVLIFFLGGVIISMFLYVFTSKKELIIAAGNVEILEKANGAEKFVDELRDQIYG